MQSCTSSLSYVSEYPCGTCSPNEVHLVATATSAGSTPITQVLILYIVVGFRIEIQKIPQNSKFEITLKLKINKIAFLSLITREHLCRKMLRKNLRSTPCTFVLRPHTLPGASSSIFFKNLKHMGSENSMCRTSKYNYDIVEPILYILT